MTENFFGRVLIILFFLILSISFLFLNASRTQAQTSTKCIYYFYGSTCPHCKKVKPVLSELEKKYPKLEIKRYEVFENQKNAKLFQKFFDYYKVPSGDQGVPIVFVGDEYIVGDTPIISMLEEYITSSKEIKCVSLDAVEGKKAQASADSSRNNKKGDTLPILAIIGAAIADSINPCAIAVLLILLSSLLFLNNRKQAFRAGIAFIIAVFISYFLIGFGLFTFINFANLSYWIYRIVGVLAIIIGLWNIKDYFWHDVGPNIEIPKSLRPIVQKLLRGVTSVPGAFAIGILVTLFELPCTGGPYFFALGILAKTSTLHALPILLLYNLFFILPLIIIFILIYYGFVSIEKTKKWQKENIERLHLVAGIILLLLGIVVVLGLV